MTIPFDADGYAADALAAQNDAMAGPLAAAMRYEGLAIGVAGRVRLDPGYWEPMIQVAPKRDLGDERLVVSAQVSGGAALAPVVFEAVTEAGAWLALMVPVVGVTRRTGAAVELQVTATLNGAALGVNALRDLVQVRVVEGMFARLLYVASVETLRLRRQTRLLHAAATLDGARGFMLDRYGQELAIPRLRDQLAVSGGAIVTVAQVESDADYRRRLAIFRRWFGPTRRSVLAALNGEGGTVGPLQQIGAPATFSLLEDDNPLYSAIRIVAVAPSVAEAQTRLDHFFAYLRAAVLIDPMVAVPATRPLPSAARAREAALRTRLKQRLSFADPKKRAMAPFLALAFDRLTDFMRAFGVVNKVSVIRAQDDGGGARHELGLGAEIAQIAAADLTTIRNGLGAPPTGLAKANLSIVAALAGGDVSDARGTWLLNACGFGTVESVAGGNLYVSHLAIGGLTITGPATMRLVDSRPGVKYAASIDSGHDGLSMALAHALSGGHGGWPAGDPPWTFIPVAQLGTTLDSLTTLDGPTSQAIGTGFAVAAASLPPFVQSTKNYASGVVAAVALDAAFAAGLAAANGAAIGRWQRLMETLGSNGAASAALFKRAAGTPVLIVSAYGLPLVGANIGARRSSGFFWNLMPVSAGAEGQCSPAGTEATFRSVTPGVYALHCLATARIGDTDPFEYRVDLPAGVSINLPQYEMLMNILGRCYPIGVEVNTWQLRRSHVTLGGIDPQPLTPRQSRSYRVWQKPHFSGVDLDRPDFAGG
ncbi:hypothetical protein EJC47_19755 [Sphingomonas sp. TF3]|uniref:hypothetical protein n=1 Tax=Sphingomonas sp. TF3 TaxID=2495580 RepID=UPI000F8835A1|nr:hypothetical protein [Sphingomonas sp. TF3]RUN74793.1 hypothetical protein EJC47_19755 [Sphingomonas sp. TF3]